jgi:hypothetical protein
MNEMAVYAGERGAVRLYEDIMEVVVVVVVVVVIGGCGGGGGSCPSLLPSC